MSSFAIAERKREMEAKILARLAGAFYLLAVAASVVEEFLMPSRLGISDFVVPVASYATVMLLLYRLLCPLSRTPAVLALISGLAGLALEPLRWHPSGVNVAMVLHGVYSLQMGLLLARTRLVPIFTGGAMMMAGVVWLGYLSTSLARAMSPWNTAVGLIGESLPMLWLLAMGVKETSRNEQMGVVR
jgi:hypothetical protein